MSEEEWLDRQKKNRGGSFWSLQNKVECTEELKSGLRSTHWIWHFKPNVVKAAVINSTLLYFFTDFVRNRQTFFVTIFHTYSNILKIHKIIKNRSVYINLHQFMSITLDLGYASAFLSLNLCQNDTAKQLFK